MTAIQYVTQKEMQRKTGLSKALGYAFPKEDKILILKGLPEEKKKEVLAHEEEHIRKGEEGPFWDAVIAGGSAVLGGLLGSNSASKASKAAGRAADAEIAFARESRDMARRDQAPYREAGYTALDALMILTGLDSPSSVSRAAQGLPQDGGLYEVPQGGAATEYDVVKAFEQYMGRQPTQDEIKYYSGRQRANQLYQDVVVPNMQRVRQQAVGSAPQGARPSPEEMLKADPGYEFRLNEGMRALDRGAAARGGLLSGGFARKALRYGQDYASNEYQNVYNRISNIAGLGSVGASNSSQAALQYGSQAGGAAANAGYTRASGYIAQGNAWGNALDQLAQVDWGGVFNRGRTPPPSGGWGMEGGWGGG